MKPIMSMIGPAPVQMVGPPVAGQVGGPSYKLDASRAGTGREGCQRPANERMSFAHVNDYEQTILLTGDILPRPAYRNVN